MTTVTGKVKGGVVVFEGKPPAEGASVTVVFDDDEPYRLSAEEIAALDEAEADLDAGHAIPAQQVMAELRQRG